MKLGAAALLLCGAACIPAIAHADECPLRFSATEIPTAQDGRSEPFNFKEQVVSQSVRARLELFCWRFDDSTGHILDASGTILKSDQYQFLIDPFDDRGMISPTLRRRLFNQGCRVDQASHILCKDGATTYFLNQLDVLTLERGDELASKNGFILKIESLLSHLPPGQPIDEATQGKIRELAQNSGLGESLPMDLGQLLDSGLPVEKLKASLEDSSERLNRFFDQSASYESLRANIGALDDRTGLWDERSPNGTTARKNPYFNSQEAEIGQRLRDGVIATLSQNPVGQEVLDHFKTASGKIDLPAFYIGEGNSIENAHYTPGRNQVVIQREYASRILMQSALPAEKGEIAYAARNSASFNAYLATHPEALDRLSHGLDVSFAHELTHAWQDRRIPIGSFSAGDPLEWEYEAYTWENRYLLADLISHPDASLDNPQHRNELVSLDHMLADYPQFLANIARAYMSGENVNVITLKQASEIAKERSLNYLGKFLGSLAEMAGRGGHMLDPQDTESRSLLGKWMLQALGNWKGHEAIERYRSDNDRRTEEFLKDVYPKMKEDARQHLPDLVAQMRSKSAKETSAWNAANDLRTALYLAQGAQAPDLANAIKKEAGAKAEAFSLRARQTGDPNFDYLIGALYMANISGDPEQRRKIVEQAEAAAREALRKAQGERDLEKRVADAQRASNLAQISGNADLKKQMLDATQQYTRNLIEEYTRRAATDPSFLEKARHLREALDKADELPDAGEWVHNIYRVLNGELPEPLNTPPMAASDWGQSVPPPVISPNPKPGPSP